jgi:hypothetical protein
MMIIYWRSKTSFEKQNRPIKGRQNSILEPKENAIQMTSNLYIVIGC